MDTIFTNDQLSMIVQNIPKYMYIKLALVNRIKTGELSVGAKLPSEKELCDAYACSRLTVRKALDVLQSEGYIRKVQGLGTFVSERNPSKQDLSTITSCSSLIRSQGKIPSKRILSRRLIPASEELARQLQVAFGSSILEYSRIYLADGIPVIYSCSYYNITLTPGLEQLDLSDKSIISVLKEQYGLDLYCSNREMRAVLSDETNSALLRVAPNYPLLQVSDLKKAQFHGMDVPVESYKFLYVTDRIRYTPEI